MRALLPWFAREARILPWREAPRDPYRVWVSEVMLQQTRVETVLRYYAAFLARFPDARALAGALEDDVMKAWEGLGYYRRARLLRRGARHVAEHGMPRTRDEWLAVPGVGPYTAGAIASLCHQEPVAAVDGNVLRVWARVTGDARDVATPAAKRAAEAWVLAHQPRGLAGAFNEALMELGATVCAPSAPRCDACPLASACRGRGRTELPRKGAKPAPREAEVALAMCWSGGKLLLEKREAGLLAGTWGLPWVEGGPRELVARVEALAGAPAQVEPHGVTRGTHVYSHVRWRMTAYQVTTSGRRGEWRDPELMALGTAHRKILRTTMQRSG
ncbi:MAG TPA: A/G-specific adenine glycosylase [Candidatus Thermoplasmatota archaeon]|nr:A/G-specific adenine glycosylase [Candidatus Thermoplasmatota archaeon]